MARCPYMMMGVQWMSGDEHTDGKEVFFLENR